MADLSDDVRAFIDERIPSVMQLEVLLHLRASGGSCTPNDVSRRVGGSLDAVIVCFTELERGGLAHRIDDETEIRYEYAPADRSLAATVDAVAAAYASRKVAVVTQIFSRPDDPLRSFSDAFRLRKDR